MANLVVRWAGSGEVLANFDEKEFQAMVDERGGSLECIFDVFIFCWDRKMHIKEHE